MAHYNWGVDDLTEATDRMLCMDHIIDTSS